MKLVANILGVIGALLGWLTLHRVQLPYNEEGRFFDSSEGVVYDTDAIPVLVVITGFVIVAALGAGFAGSRKLPASLQDAMAGGDGGTRAEAPAFVPGPLQGRPVPAVSHLSRRSAAKTEPPSRSPRPEGPRHHSPGQANPSRRPGSPTSPAAAPCKGARNRPSSLHRPLSIPPSTQQGSSPIRAHRHPILHSDLWIPASGFWSLSNH